MKHLWAFFLIATLFGLLLTGCDGEQGTVTGVPIAGIKGASNGSGEEPLVVKSAKLYIYEFATDAVAPVNAHAIMKSWDEHTVTYHNFIQQAPLPAFDPAIVGSFSSGPDAGLVLEWRWVDVTSLVKAWVEASKPNYGILLEEAALPYTVYYSSEWEDPTLGPKLEITFVTPSGNEVTKVIQRGLNGSVVADAYVWAADVNENGGNNPPYLYTGLVADYQKYTLLRFEWIPYDAGCTRTIGYWKTHVGFGPQADAVTPLLPVTLGTVGGSKSLVVGNAQTAVDVLSMKVYGVPSNGITKLYAQLLAARLNLLNGAGPGSIVATILAADAFLGGHDYTYWNSTLITSAEKAQILAWQADLDAYNNGLLGPGHCK